MKTFNGKRIGYVRVSTIWQNHERQLDGIELDRCFIDKASGKTVDRPQLDELLAYVREGDSVLVHSMDRLARNVDDLRKLVQTLTNQNIKVEFLKEGLSFTGEESPMSQLLLSVMGAFAQFERSLIKERQMEGITIAKNKGLYRGRKKCLTQEQVEEIKARVDKGDKKSHVARDFGISRETLYTYMRKEQLPIQKKK